jgi:hypothetical protein
MPLFQDLFVRDTWSDNGTEPVTDASVSASPDIIPYAQSTLTSDQLISSYSSGVLLDKGVLGGRLNNIYVRAKNNAPGATAGQLYIYFAAANLLVQPSVWKQNKVQNGNGTQYANLSATTNLQITPGDQPFFFTPSQSLGNHFCFLACIEKTGRPSPIPTTNFTSWQNFVDWIRAHANVSWHNVDVSNTLPPEGFRQALTFTSVDTTPTYHGFLTNYRNLPDGAVLRLYALANPPAGFAGFDVSITIPSGGGTGQIGQGAVFPAGYSTTVFTTCVFPGKPPSDYVIQTTSLGYVPPLALEKHARFRPIMLASVPFKVAGVEDGGSFVPIASYTSYFNNSPA